MMILQGNFLRTIFLIFSLVSSQNLLGMNDDRVVDITGYFKEIRKDKYKYLEGDSAEKFYRHLSEFIKEGAESDVLAGQYLDFTYRKELDPVKRAELVNQIKSDHSKYINNLRAETEERRKAQQFIINDFLDSRCVIAELEPYSYASTFLFVLAASKKVDRLPDGHQLEIALQSLRAGAAQGQYSAVLMLTFLNELTEERQRNREDWNKFLYYAVINGSVKFARFLYNSKHANPFAVFGQKSGDTALGQAIIKNNDGMIKTFLSEYGLARFGAEEFINTLKQLRQDYDGIEDQTVQLFVDRIPKMQLSAAEKVAKPSVEEEAGNQTERTPQDEANGLLAESHLIDQADEKPTQKAQSSVVVEKDGEGGCAIRSGLVVVPKSAWENVTYEGYYKLSEKARKEVVEAQEALKKSKAEAAAEGWDWAD